MTTYQYALEFGFNLGEATPGSNHPANMRPGVAIRSRESVSGPWSRWDYFDNRRAIVSGSYVYLRVANIGERNDDLVISSDPLPELVSKRATNAPPGQTATTVWGEEELPLIDPGVVDGNHRCAGLNMNGVQLCELGGFTAHRQSDIERASRFDVILALTVLSGGQFYKFKQDPELVVGGETGTVTRPSSGRRSSRGRAGRGAAR